MVILKNYEDHILQLKYEDLLQFLINDIVKSGFFNDTNYDNFITISNSFNLKNGLMSNLENEYIQEEKINELDEQMSQESSSLQKPSERKKSESDKNL